MYSPSPKLFFIEKGQALAHPKGGVGADEMQPPSPKQIQKKKHIFFRKIT
jgi:hypothetical protein